MQNKKTIISIVICAFALLVVGAGNALAQPSAAQIKKDISGPKTVSVTLGDPGTVEWSSTYKKYVWSRNFVAKVKTDETGIFILVTGYASYDVMAGRYVYWRTFTSSNSYSGIPNPTAADVQALIKRFGVHDMMGDYPFRQMIGNVESIGLASDPSFEWHTQNSVSFNIVAVYTKKGNGNTAPSEHGQQTFRIRLYRDDTKADWKSVHSTSIRKEWKAI